jgi:pimeloyl-ACP methyl ester carboxylesterase
MFGRGGQSGLGRAAMLLALAAGVVGVAGGVGGCAARSAAAPDRGELVAQEVADAGPVRWPARCTTDLEPAIGSSARVLVSNWVPELGVSDASEATAIAGVASVKAYGQGVVREFDPSVGVSRLARLMPTAQFLSFASGDQAVETLADPRVWRTIGDSTRIEYFAPVAAIEGAPAPEPRGLVIHLGSLGGRSYELPVLEQFRRRGWAVVRLNAATAWERERPVTIESTQTLEPAAERLAGMIDNRIAEIAYAAEAATLWVRDRHPEVPTDRVIVAGFSAGALAAPAAAVRLGERVRAVVLVGVGADVLDVSQSSTLTNGGIRLRWPQGRRDDAAWESLKRLYLARTSLDPYALGPRLTGTPTLMLHGALDEIVPSWTGDLAYERLGRPERWTVPMGHKGLFWRLGAYAREISVWADEAAAGTNERATAAR